MQWTSLVSIQSNRSMHMMKSIHVHEHTRMLVTSNIHIRCSGSTPQQQTLVYTACNIAQTCKIQWVSTIWTPLVGTDLQHSGSTHDGLDLIQMSCSFTHQYQIQWIHTAASQLYCFGWKSIQCNISQAGQMQWTRSIWSQFKVIDPCT